MCRSQCMAYLHCDGERALQIERAAVYKLTHVAASTNCITMKCTPSTSSRSKIVQMFAWSSDEASRASRAKRFKLTSLTVSSGSSTLMTTVRPSFVERLVDCALPAGAELFENGVLKQSLTDHWSALSFFAPVRNESSVELITVSV